MDSHYDYNLYKNSKEDTKKSNKKKEEYQVWLRQG